MSQLFINNLTVIDFSYFDNKLGILGESWMVDIELSGELDDQGMIFDFGHVKKKIKSIIDQELDHRFVISTQTKNLTVEHQEGICHLSWQHALGHFQHQSPDSAVVLLDARTINTKSIARYLEALILKELPKNITKVTLTLAEESIDQAYYHYSHGLKKHQGNCQRIIHGHRSRIEIYENHQRNPKLEDYWAACFRNAYIGTTADITEERDIEGKMHVTFSYGATQGKFSVTLPKKRIYLLDTDTTVELIARHVAQKCAEKKPHNHYLVKAFEGIGKGAIATCRL